MRSGVYSRTRVRVRMRTGILPPSSTISKPSSNSPSTHPHERSRNIENEFSGVVWACCGSYVGAMSEL